jgi:hypothetical protein
MIRTVVTPKNQELSILLPPNYVGKRVEVIAFTVDEAIDEAEKNDNPLTHFTTEKVLSKDWLTPEEDTAWETL